MQAEPVGGLQSVIDRHTQFRNLCLLTGFGHRPGEEQNGAGNGREAPFQVATRRLWTACYAFGGYWAARRGLSPAILFRHARPRPRCCRFHSDAGANLRCLYRSADRSALGPYALPLRAPSPLGACRRAGDDALGLYALSAIRRGIEPLFA